LPRVKLTDTGVAFKGKLPPLRRAAFTTGHPSTGLSTRTLVLMAAGLGVLLALAALWGLMARRRRVVMEPSGFRAGGRDFLRVHGDRMRVAFDERGVEVLILGLGLAAAVGLGALVAG
jgi:LPXTG-motif cell wall-anchored protein